VKRGKMSTICRLDILKVEELPVLLSLRFWIFSFTIFVCNFLFQCQLWSILLLQQVSERLGIDPSRLPGVRVRQLGHGRTLLSVEIQEPLFQPPSYSILWYGPVLSLAAKVPASAPSSQTSTRPANPPPAVPTASVVATQRVEEDVKMASPSIPPARTGLVSRPTSSSPTSLSSATSSCLPSPSAASTQVSSVPTSNLAAPVPSLPSSSASSSARIGAVETSQFSTSLGLSANQWKKVKKKLSKQKKKVKEVGRGRADEDFEEVMQEKRKLVKLRDQVLGERASRRGSAATNNSSSSSKSESKQSNSSVSSRSLASLFPRGLLDLGSTGLSQDAPTSGSDWGISGTGDEEDMDAES